MATGAELKMVPTVADASSIYQHRDGSRQHSPRATENVEEKVPVGGNIDNTTLNVTGSSNEQLPRVDGGLRAWRFLFAAFMMEAFQWGQYYSHSIGISIP